MTDHQLKEIYKAACHGKGFEPSDGQFKVWKQTLGWCEEKHLAQALIWWFEGNTGFPMPADLKPLSERARRESVVKLSTQTELVGYTCPDCGIHASAFVQPGDNRPRICRGIPHEDRDGICGAILRESFRGPSSSAVSNNFQHK